MMKTKIVVTNLRIPEDEWLQVKATAAELGMSANEYIKKVIREVSHRRQFGIIGVSDKPIEKSIWDLAELAKMPNKPLGKLSAEDETIYGE